VVHLFADQGLQPSRLSMIGYGEFRPRADNDSQAGRNANRRVVLVILADAGDTDPNGIETGRNAAPVVATGAPAAQDRSSDAGAAPAPPTHPAGASRAVPAVN
jgi:chemotaxis protein MotB